MRYLAVEADAKTKKGNKFGYLTGIQYLAPYNVSGHNVCKDSTPGCRASCLYYAGHGAFPKVMQARIRKTNEIFEMQKTKAGKITHNFELTKDINSLITMSKKRQMVPCVRLNGTSDLPWEKITPELFKTFYDLQFYDYTKSYKRMVEFLSSHLESSTWPANYHLTFSLSENNAADARNVLANGGNVAVVFNCTIPLMIGKHPVIDGDKSDLRFLDAPSSIIALKAKGRRRKDKSGFVVEHENLQDLINSL